MMLHNGNYSKILWQWEKWEKNAFLKKAFIVD